LDRRIVREEATVEGGGGNQVESGLTREIAFRAVEPATGTVESTARAIETAAGTVALSAWVVGGAFEAGGEAGAGGQIAVFIDAHDGDALAGLQPDDERAGAVAGGDDGVGFHGWTLEVCSGRCDVGQGVWWSKPGVAVAIGPFRI
jgi:hypothetical protein